jgi:hypothetical protein
MSEASLPNIGDKVKLTAGPYPVDWVYTVLDVITSRAHGVSVELGQGGTPMLTLTEKRWYEIGYMPKLYS